MRKWKSPWFWLTVVMLGGAYYAGLKDHDGMCFSFGALAILAAITSVIED